MPAQKRPLHKDVRVIGGVSATVGILLMIALFSGSKKPPPPPTTRGEAVAPRPASEPVAAPTPSQPPPIAAPTPSKSLPSPAPEPAHSKKPSHAGPPGHLAPGKAHVVGGGLTAQQIALVLEDYLPTIEHCYADALAQKSHLQGRVVFGWTIEKNGHPSRVRTLSGTLKDDELQQCSAEAIKKARFPKPKKKTSEITWPLDYKKS
jgi:outer membrane biosynthesis protein TonB